MEAQFVTVCHMATCKTRRVCVYKGVSQNEMEKLISSVFKTGNRRIVGLSCGNDVVPLSTMSHDPSVLRNDKRYAIVFGNGKIENHIMPYDFHAVIHHIDSFVNSLRQRNFLDAREASTIRDLIKCADRAVLLAFTYYRIDRNINLFAHTLVRLAKISDAERKRSLARILSLNECVKRFGYSSKHAHILQRAVLAGDSRMDQIFSSFELSGEDYGALRNSLENLTSENDVEEEVEEEEEEDPFQELLDAMIESGNLNIHDAAWIRGRRVAGDSELVEIASEIRSLDLDGGDISNTVDRLVSLSIQYEKMRSVKRQNLAQLIDDIPQNQITSKNRKELHLLAIEGNDLVLSAYEMFAVDLDQSELFETLLMILMELDGTEECCGVDTSGIDPEFVGIIRDVVYGRKIMSSQIGEVVLRLMQASDEFILAAFQVYKEQKSDTNRLSEFLDTIGRVVQRRVQDVQSTNRLLQERDEILEILKTSFGQSNVTLVSYFMQNLVPGPAVDGVRIALKTFAEDNDKSNLLESLEHIMELMCSKEKAEQEKLEMRKNKIELKALITSMLVERVATLPVATALRRLADQDDPHVMAAYDVYLESDRNKSDLYDTMLRIGQRAVENRAPFHQNSRHQAHDEVLSIVSTLDLSQENRDLLLKCIENGDPTVSSAIQVYVETRDLDEFKEMLRVIAENREDEDDDEEEPTVMFSPDASIISHSSNNNTTFFSPAMSVVSSTNNTSSSSRRSDNLKKRVDSDRIFSTALRALTSAKDPLNSSEIALLQNMYDDNDMIMTVALDFYSANKDMDELLDTLRTAVRAARIV